MKNNCSSSFKANLKQFFPIFSSLFPLLGTSAHEREAKALVDFQNSITLPVVSEIR